MLSWRSDAAWQSSHRCETRRSPGEAVVGGTRTTLSRCSVRQSHRPQRSWVEIGVRNIDGGDLHLGHCRKLNSLLPTSNSFLAHRSIIPARESACKSSSSSDTRLRRIASIASSLKLNDASNCVVAVGSLAAGEARLRGWSTSGRIKRNKRSCEARLSGGTRQGTAMASPSGMSPKTQHTESTPRGAVPSHAAGMRASLATARYLPASVTKSCPCGMTMSAGASCARMFKVPSPTP
mmetsp:Transcript_115935/g.332919  ORF Transcript_115935/g.332919 Transcript_115935/m.332919 type:complete len:236 (-) Transcript_115935:1030-1737(-)